MADMADGVAAVCEAGLDELAEDMRCLREQLAHATRVCVWLAHYRQDGMTHDDWQRVLAVHDEWRRQTRENPHGVGE